MNLILVLFRREEFFTALKKVYYETCNENLPIYGIAAPKLKEYSTSKKDMKAGKEVTPEERDRIKAEDIYTPKQAGAGGSAANGFGQKGGNG
jgi:hypothetical protein